jgi:hypothetical protein
MMGVFATAMPSKAGSSAKASRQVAKPSGRRNGVPAMSTGLRVERKAGMSLRMRATVASAGEGRVTAPLLSSASATQPP